MFLFCLTYGISWDKVQFYIYYLFKFPIQPPRFCPTQCFVCVNPWGCSIICDFKHYLPVDHFGLFSTLLSPTTFSAVPDSDVDSCTHHMICASFVCRFGFCDVMIYHWPHVHFQYMFYVLLYICPYVCCKKAPRFTNKTSNGQIRLSFKKGIKTNEGSLLN